MFSVGLWCHLWWLKEMHPDTSCTNYTCTIVFFCVFFYVTGILPKSNCLQNIFTESLRRQKRCLSSWGKNVSDYTTIKTQANKPTELERIFILMCLQYRLFVDVLLECVCGAVGSGVVLPGQPWDFQGLREARLCDRLWLWFRTPTV